MRCPKCNMEISDSAKFCKYCGTPLNKNNSQIKSNTSLNNNKENNNTKIIIIALLLIIVALIGAFAYLSLANSNNDSDSTTADNNLDSLNESVNDSNQATSHSAQASKPANTSPITISGGSITTGSDDSDYTYADLYLGSSNAGRSVYVQIFYSRNGNSLNSGNMVPLTVDSNGYVEVTSSQPFKYYPDHATIKVYDSNQNLKDTLSVSLSPTSGTQSF